jgi:hypothetical protein
MKSDNTQKKAVRPGTAVPNNEKVSYSETSGKSSRLPKFPASVKERWKIRRDQNGDEYIVVNGKESLVKSGLAHIYMISGVRVGAWVSSKKINLKVRNLQKQIAGLRVEQMGDGEAVLSININQIDGLCRAVNARSRRKVGVKQREHLRRISPFARRQKTLTKSTFRRPKMPKNGKGVH